MNSDIQKSAPLPGQYSVFLDIWRLLATFAVFLGHLTRPDVLFDVDVAPLGRGTIPTFLIISAYLAAMSFQKGGHFGIRVAERYYSLYAVFLPASVLVLLMDIWLIHVGSPLILNDKFDPDLSLGRIGVEVFQLFTFSGEYWSPSTFGQGVFSNQAYWTMDYILAYTVGTAAFYLLRGWKRSVALVVIALIAGPTVLLLAPIWVAGVAAFEMQKRIDARAHRSGMAVSRRLGGAVIVVAVACWVSIEAFGWGADLYAWSKTLAPYEIRQHLGMAKRFLWQWAYIVPLTLMLVAAKYALSGSVSAVWQRRVSNAAKYSLPFYAIHFSLIYLVQSWFPGYEARHDAWQPYAVGAITIVLAIVFGYAQLRWIAPPARRLRRRLFARSASAQTKEAVSPAN